MYNQVVNQPLEVQYPLEFLDQISLEENMLLRTYLFKYLFLSF